MSEVALLKEDDQLKNRAFLIDTSTTTSDAKSTSTMPQKEDDAKQQQNNNNGLVASLVAWYAASVVCTNTSKTLALPWQWLTLSQLMIGSASAYFGIAVLKLNGRPSSRLVDLVPTSNAIWQSTTILTATFVGGFVTLNMALRQMHVSTVMTIRAAEPVATLLLGLYFLPNEKTALPAVAALIPVVAGAAMASTVTSSSDAGDENSFEGLFIVLLCNCLFALRTIFTKRLKASCPSLDNFTLFFQLCVIGTVLQLVLLCGMVIYSRYDTTTTTSMWIDLNDGFMAKLPILLVNGISFYAYLQLSWVVMGQVGAVTHSVCNALRRPVICAAGWMLFGGATVQGVMGALMATGGTMLYAHAKRKAAAAAASAEEENGPKKVETKTQDV